MAKRMTEEEREEVAEIEAIARFLIEHKNMPDIKELIGILKRMEEDEALSELERFGVTIL